MKMKNKIIETTPEISKEEVESHKDFDSLLKNFEDRGGYAMRVSLTGRIIAGIVTLGIISLIGYYLVNRNPTLEPRITKIEKSTVQEPINEGDNKEKEVLIAADKKINNPITKNSSPEKTLKINEETKDVSSNKKSIVKKKGNVEITNEIKDSELNSEEGQSVDLSEEPNYEYIEATPLEGMSYLYAYFEKNLTYPDELRKDSIEGVVLIQFAILRDSTLANVNVVQSLGEQFDQEAMRIIKNMPQWKPATVNDVPVNSKLSIPLTFTIEK